MTGPRPVLEAVALLEEVRERLNGIIDPCSITAGAPAGLVDMGLVRDLRLEPDGQGGQRAVVAIGITHPFCMMAGVFLNEVRKRVILIEGVDDVEVCLDSDTIWTPELMTQAYRDRLETARQAKGVSAERGRGKARGVVPAI